MARGPYAAEYTFVTGQVVGVTDNATGVDEGVLSATYVEVDSTSHTESESIVVTNPPLEESGTSLESAYVDVVLTQSDSGATNDAMQNFGPLETDAGAGAEGTTTVSAELFDGDIGTAASETGRADATDAVSDTNNIPVESTTLAAAVADSDAITTSDDGYKTIEKFSFDVGVGIESEARAAYATAEWGYTFSDHPGNMNYINVVQLDDAVAYWKFEESDGAEAFDSSGYENHGVYSDVTFGEEGLPGSPAILMSNLSTFRADLNVTLPNTIELWVRSGNAENFSIGLDFDTGTVILNVPSTADGELHYVVVGMDSETDIATEAGEPIATESMFIQVFVDNEVQSTANIPALATALTSVFLGAETLTDFVGWVDEAAVYDYSLTNAQRDLHMQIGTSGLVGIQVSIDSELNVTEDGFDAYALDWHTVGA